MIFLTNKPSRIVMETLNVKGMMKNKHLAKAIQKQKFYEFKRQICYKCQKYGIEFVEVPTFYPSSKTCSCCGSIKEDLKLCDRIYRCKECGLVLDREQIYKNLIYLYCDIPHEIPSCFTMSDFVRSTFV